MTSRADIIDGAEAVGRKYGLIYTKKCGWVDLGHANPTGALSLWNQILNEVGSGNEEDGYFKISYKQTMGKPYFKVGVSKNFYIKRGLNISEKRSVALAIFMNVSQEFESLQGGMLFRKFTNSGFSAEDLVSNLIGFYRAIEPNGLHLQACEPVSKKIALSIWDKYGAVGDMKNYSYFPYVFPIPPASGGPMSAQLPFWLTSVKPAKLGVRFREIK